MFEMSDLEIIARVIMIGRRVDISSLSPSLFDVVQCMRGEHDIKMRAQHWQTFVRLYPDAEEIMTIVREFAIAINHEIRQADPPQEVVRDGPLSLSLEDLEGEFHPEKWVWPYFIPVGELSAVAANAGDGKTRFCIDLCKRIWNGETWPDGTPINISHHLPSLWVCSDGQQRELLEISRAMGLPKEAIRLNTTMESKFGGTKIDSDQDLERLERFIDDLNPAMVFIDSLTFATTKYDLNRADDVGKLLTPLKDITQRKQIPIFCTVHLSLGGDVLGRRSGALLRVIMRLEKQRRDSQGQFVLSVSKSFDKVPPKLLVQVTDTGNLYSAVPQTSEFKSTSEPKASISKGDRIKQQIFSMLAVTDNQLWDHILSEIKKSDDMKDCDRTFRNTVRDLRDSGQLILTGRASERRIQLP